jgi:hypothetical protein
LECLLWRLGAALMFLCMITILKELRFLRVVRSAFVFVTCYLYAILSSSRTPLRVHEHAEAFSAINGFISHKRTRQLIYIIVQQNGYRNAFPGRIRERKLACSFAYWYTNVHFAKEPFVREFSVGRLLTFDQYCTNLIGLVENSQALVS